MPGMCCTRDSGKRAVARIKPELVLRCDFARQKGRGLVPALSCTGARRATTARGASDNADRERDIAALARVRRARNAAADGQISGYQSCGQGSRKEDRNEEPRNQRGEQRRPKPQEPRAIGRGSRFALRRPCRGAFDKQDHRESCERRARRSGFRRGPSRARRAAAACWGCHAEPVGAPVARAALDHE